jgi:hypothetical protein
MLSSGHWGDASMINRLAIAVLMLFGAAGAALGQGSVYYPGYVNPYGTYVPPHYQSAPNGTRFDNWSVSPNVNPYTGQMGRRSPVPTYSVPAYPSAPQPSSGYRYRRR